MGMICSAKSVLTEDLYIVQKQGLFNNMLYVLICEGNALFNLYGLKTEREVRKCNRRVSESEKS
jgi:hypothetical protein